LLLTASCFYEEKQMCFPVSAKQSNPNPRYYTLLNVQTISKEIVAAKQKLLFSIFFQISPPLSLHHCFSFPAKTQQKN